MKKLVDEQSKQYGNAQEASVEGRGAMAAHGHTFVPSMFSCKVVCTSELWKGGHP